MRTGMMIVSAALLVTLSAGGCSPGRGKYTADALQKANERVAGMKSANEHQQAWQSYASGDLDKALKSIDRSLTLNPNVAKSHVLKGRILIEKGQLEQSLESFKAAEAIDPSNVEAQYYQGIVYERFSQKEQALEKFKRAAEIEPTSAQYALATAEILMDLDQLDEAEAFLAGRAASLEHNAGVRQTLGHIAMLKGDPAKGAKLFAEARLLAPDDAGILEDLVQAQIETSQFADAEYNIARMLKVPANKDRRDLLHMRARCLMELERPNDAREIYAELTKDDAGQRDIEAWIGLGNTSYILRDMLRLRQSSSRVLALAPTRPEGYILRAWFQLRTNDTEQALTSLDKAIERRGDQVEPLMLKAMVLKQLGRDAEAEQYLAAANAPSATVTNAPVEGPTER